MMKKVCILTSAHPALDTRIFHKQARSLATAGYSVVVIGRHEKNEVIDGIEIIALSKPRHRISRILLRTLKVLYLAIRQNANVYHFHDLELLIAGILLKKVFRKKVVYDIHEDEPKSILSKEYIPSSLRTKMSASIRFFQKKAARHFDYVVAAGQDIADSFAGTPVYGKIVVVRNVPPQEFIQACEKKGNYSANGVVYAGVLSKQRGIKELVEAINYVRSDAQLHLLGSFPDPRFEAEIRTIASSRVKLLGEISYKDIPEVLRTMSIGLICFHPEPNHIGALSGRNNKFYEYMAAGLAIIASNFPSWKEIVEKENVGVTVDPRDVREIALAIDFLLENPNFLNAVRENGTKAVRERFNWEVEKEGLLTLYGSL
jgi:glycosyltransferase involved in cell wall biosynthesis